MKHLIALVIVSLFALGAQAGEACCKSKGGCCSKPTTTAKSDGSVRGAQLLMAKK